MNAIECRQLTCHRAEWNPGPSSVHDLSLQFEAGLIHGLCGDDGCGKGLLLHLLSLMETPDTGEITLAGQPTPALDDPARDDFRNTLFGFLFPSPCLLLSFTVAENVAMPLFRFSELDAAGARARTREILRFMEIDDLECASVLKLNHRLRQRVALARALAHDPKILIAVSPSESAELFPFVKRICDESGLTVLWAGSAEELDDNCDRVISLEAGRVIDDTATPC